ncbi:ABC transporter substrate-binding protein [Anaerobranca gottschalkii]|uniref:Iron complex transport system substrate-binding protein n=1 Tax=Anaerobranca gottschalkii DSM 13577 TaxID=1120990 RepID=A0A1I0A1M5_9FIRM|nr:ABC transporter substrate-binding protein [Anaerobranca gottschalkii]SES87995.1 iron complex transport system substrate-binding protein [Anaerobranca gottschalkii DSM 13577]
MFKRVLSLFLILVLALFLVTGCSTKDEGKNLQEKEQKEAIQTEYPLTITDSYDNEIVINEQPKRVISVAPSITETIFALNKDVVLVGRTDFCDYPAKVSEIPSIGTLRNPNIEQIVALEPDLVIASTHFTEEVYNKLQELDIPVLVLNPNDSFEGVYHVIITLGKVLDANEKAEKVVEEMKNTVKEVKNKVKDLEKPRVYYVIGFGEFGDWTAGKGTFISEMINMAGAINVADDIEGWSYSLEKLLEHDPDLLIVSNQYNAKEGIMSTEGYKELTAVKEGRVYEIDNNLLDRQGPRLASGLKELAKIFHPEVIK